MISKYNLTGQKLDDELRALEISQGCIVISFVTVCLSVILYCIRIS